MTMVDSGKVTSRLAVYLVFNTFVSSCLSKEIYGIAATTLFDYVNWDFNITMLAESALHCLALCATLETCSGVFFHPTKKMCLLCNDTYSTATLLESYSGMEYYRIRASTCSDLASLGFTRSGLWQLDPDGIAEEFGAVTVLCDLTSEPGKAITVLHHDKETETFVEGYESCGSYTISLNYSVGFEVARMIVDKSTDCTQYIRYDCYNSVVISVSSGEPCVIWMDRNREKSHYFTGSGSYPAYCDCSQTSSCSHKSGCNCNYNDKKWRYDEGNVTNKDDLPITGFQLGDTGGYSSSREMAKHTIGPLYCW